MLKFDLLGTLTKYSCTHTSKRCKIKYSLLTDRGHYKYEVCTKVNREKIL